MKRVMLGIAAIALLLVTTETANAQSWRVGGWYGGYPVVSGSYGTVSFSTGYPAYSYGYAYPSYGYAYPAYGYRSYYASPVYYSTPMYYSSPYYYSPGYGVSYYRGGWGWRW